MEPLPCTWLDRTGDLKEGVFYKFSVADEDALRRFADPATAILSKRVATDAQLLATGKEGYLWVEAWGEGPDRKKFECSTYPTHQTSWQLTDVQYALRKSGEFADFVSDAGQNTGPGWFVSGDFADGLRTSGLKGFRLDPVKNLESVCEEDRLSGLSVPTAQLAKKLRLHLLTFEVRRCLRAWSVRNVENACPWCGNRPVICPGCGTLTHVCPACGNRCLYQGSRQHYPLKYLETDIRPLFSEAGRGAKSNGRHRPYILEGRKHDGSDFIYPNFISHRALTWLLDQKAAPFFVVPAVVDVAGLTTEQKRRIDSVKS